MLKIISASFLVIAAATASAAAATVVATTLAHPKVAGASASSPACQVYKQQLRHNHKVIDAAYENKDACTMGKLMIQNRQIFESHPECFPKIARRLAPKPQPVVAGS